MAYLGNTPELQNFTAGADRFSGNASTTVFTLNRRVLNANDVIAYIESVPQDPFTAYTLAANTTSGTADITFTSAPPTGTNNIVVNYRATQIVSYNQVTSSVIQAGAVTTAKIADGAITADKIADGTVIAADIADGSITTAKIADANVTDAKIVSVANTKITGVINTSQIADSAITTDKIAAGAVVTADIADANVTDAKIVSVANTKITGVITASQLANTAVTAGVYGGSSNSALITIDAQGRITSASNVAAGSGQIQTEIFTSPGTWTKPSTASQVKVTVIGGGGGMGQSGMGAGGAQGGGTSSFGPLVSATGGAGGAPGGAQPGIGSSGSGSVSAPATTIKSGVSVVPTGHPSPARSEFLGVVSGTIHRGGPTSNEAYSTTGGLLAGASGGSGGNGSGGFGGLARAIVPVTGPVSVTVGAGGNGNASHAQPGAGGGVVVVEYVG